MRRSIGRRLKQSNALHPVTGHACPSVFVVCWQHGSRFSVLYADRRAASGRLEVGSRPGGRAKDRRVVPLKPLLLGGQLLPPCPRSSSSPVAPAFLPSRRCSSQPQRPARPRLPSTYPPPFAAPGPLAAGRPPPCAAQMTRHQLAPPSSPQPSPAPNMPPEQHRHALAPLATNLDELRPGPLGDEAAGSAYSPLESLGRRVGLARSRSLRQVRLASPEPAPSSVVSSLLTPRPPP